ncbi:MAG: hypothetical protein NTY30_02310 [Candidatus Berkelbacteria bacterium]|nr:hypothetical protein [Candidatus Berkelbacteria bacterium]
MRSNSSKKEAAIKLRSRGLSYSEIDKRISVPKSTLAYWLKDVCISEQIKQDNITKAKSIWAKNISDFNRKRSKEYFKNREETLQNYAKKVAKLSDRELWWLGMGLYLGEGEKLEKHKIRFVNSDPAIVAIMMSFFTKCCGIEVNKFQARIHCYNNQNYDNILKFWSRLTKIKPDKFWKPQIVESKNKSHKLENGTLHLTVSDSKLNLKIHGWMQGIKFQFMPM